ncbi:helix-turn-helix transcriptional regulator [Plantactinospora sp. B24E8]|uniref:helix-turn-helix transcriptional regulator n=1 Tax=Plantactinospora sp. B24E8 TaxID=3153567 RepID=UPI00325F3108
MPDRGTTQRWRRTHRRVLAELTQLSAATLPSTEVYDRADALLRPVLGYDGVCWHDSDPATGLVTSVVSPDLRLSDFHAAVELEVWGDDIATFPVIRRSGRAAETLSRATGGRPEQSLRYRDQIRPAGYGDELRAVFDSRGGRWGCAAFMRAPDRGHYRPEELSLANAAAPLIGAALRRSTAGSGTAGRIASNGPAAPAPAVLVVGPDNRVLHADERAEELLGRLSADTAALFGVPLPFVMAAEHARAVAAGRPVPEPPLRVRTTDGGWHALHASLLGRSPRSPVAVVVTPAGPAELIPVTFAAYGFTEREAQVALYAARGLNTAEIAAALLVSPYTVQDHLKAVFDKAGVRSRREFVAMLLTANQADAAASAAVVRPAVSGGQ